LRIEQPVPGAHGRQVSIAFRDREHSIRLTNEKGNYHRWH
jgi:hypothetical protein